MSALGNFFKEVADAIRTKTGKTNGIAPINFPQEILSIETGITPSGQLEITENGTHDVTSYATVVINVTASESDPEVLNIKYTIPQNVAVISTKSESNDGYPLCQYPISSTVTLIGTFVNKGECILLMPTSTSMTLKISEVTGGVEDATSNIGLMRGKMVGVKVNGAGTFKAVLS